MSPGIASSMDTWKETQSPNSAQYLCFRTLAQHLISKCRRIMNIVFNGSVPVYLVLSCRAACPMSFPKHWNLFWGKIVTRVLARRIQISEWNLVEVKASSKDPLFSQKSMFICSVVKHDVSLHVKRTHSPLGERRKRKGDWRGKAEPGGAKMWF